LLSPEEHRDADTWGIRLLELVDRGFAPQATIADFASGLRAGHQEALPGRPCRGDVFHALYDVGPLVRYLENRAYEAMGQFGVSSSLWGQFGVRGQFGVSSSLLLPLHQVGKLDSWEDFQDRQAMTLFTTRSTAGTTEPMSSAPRANGI
jgi:hypothetical protein